MMTNFKTSNVNIKHQCHFCPQWFYTEQANRTHELFEHICYITPCSTGVAEIQFRNKTSKFKKELHERHMAKRKPTRYNSNLTNFTGAWKFFD